MVTQQIMLEKIPIISSSRKKKKGKKKEKKAQESNSSVSLQKFFRCEIVLGRNGPISF